MTISMVGPSYPFRGGIAKHTTLLFHYLRKRHRVRFYSFKRQYPKWLFPGSTDRDTSRQPLVEAGTERLLDSLNPLTWVKVARRIIADRPDVVLIPWWTCFWTPQFLTIVLLSRLFSSARILFVCHNVYDHDASFFSRACARLVLSTGDRFVVHSQDDWERLRRIVPERKIKLAFLTSNECFQPQVSAEEARQELGIVGDALLFFGFVRPYKGLEYLLKALPLVLAERPVTLLIVGESWNGAAALGSHIAGLGLQNHVKRIDQYVPDEEVGKYFSAADLVVLPYLSCTGSGILQTAFSFNRPVVATRVGSLPKEVDDGRTGYLVNPEDERALADAVLRFFRENRSAEFSANIRRDKGRFSWDRFIQIIEEAVTGGRQTEPSEFRPKAETA